ncbi:MAG: phosphoserine phosphatase SerB [Spirochaetes bacterium GWF1_31_7]|nr:MAG: phosphoserine phosphatase SerB [Spirochaetes bacterium GWE1_32_154]OHD48043.1 MAG: phosphoserine phosphatase SerB [Spirochaetes bacterium GWF1_31_7]OHD49640.1 MAG: phosphoserine phosphatase SerB [Spirochaetes bacterium GWE2_31_10]OHD81733.1 MAG: phosphoserine phosphatase SerB [Spirochaetes bacterium RIFOXYB1_FULL_32_8]HBD96192.1 phosphoserine phosphatase SerB [Spirochaetia bacterium]
MKHNSEIILLKISGEDKPGVTSSVTSILADNNANILDIGQAVIHNTLSLGILVEIPGESESSPLLKDLLFKAYELGVKISFVPVSSESYDNWVQSQGKGRYIVSLVSRKLTAKQISKVSEVIYNQGLNIDSVNRLSGRISLHEDNNLHKACVELTVRGNPESIESIQASFMDISQTDGVDIAFQKDDVYRRNRRLVCFDMDSTLIQTEVIVELAKAHGVGEKVHEITEAAMRGEIDFKESFKQRVALLEGLDISVMKKIADNLPITEGAHTLISNLKKFGYKIAVLSGGFTYFGEHLQKILGIDYVYANELEIKDEKLTGKHCGEIVDGERKALLLRQIADESNISLAQVIAVGDGANDLPMINIAGLGIAYHAKPIVKKNAKHSISTVGLDGILYLLGFRDRDIE